MPAGYGDGRLRAPSYRGTYEDFICARRVPARSRSGDRAAGHGDHHRRRHRSDRRRLARSDGHGARARIGLEAATLTNVAGVYLISPVPIDTYDVEAELQGFRRAVTRSLEVHAGDRPCVDFELTLGTVPQEVLVSAAPPLLERESSALRQVIETRAIEDLPVRGGELSDADAADRRRDAGHGASRPDGRLQRERPPRAADNCPVDGIDNNSNVLGCRTGRRRCSFLRSTRSGSSR